ncbi:MAG: MFS transporter [Acidimicrobiia bacterium]|nr:MFS transporter [Acidimicrobiia bacterium]
MAGGEAALGQHMETVTGNGQGAPAELDPRRWGTLSILCLSLLMVVVGNTALNVAIPTLVRDIKATDTQLQWIVDAYSLVFAGLLLTAGALGDRFGRKGALTIGLCIFGTGSFLAGISDTPNQLIVCRAIMGMGGAFVMPATLSILTNVFPVHERARAIAIWAGVAGAGGAIGPITSGFLLAHFHWGSVFFINLPLIAIALVGGKLLVPTSRDPNRLPLDPVGSLLTIVGLASLLYGIIEAPIKGWSDAHTIASFALAVVVLGEFAIWEWRNPHPMLDLNFFKRKRFTGGATAITLVFFGMFGMFFLITQYLQFVKGWTPLGAGVRLLPFAVVMMFTAPTSARIAERVGTKRTVALGLAIAAVGLFVASRLQVNSAYGLLVVAFAVMALGMAMTMPSSTASILSSLPMGKQGVGSAVNDTTRELGGALGVAVLGSIFATRYTSALGSLSHLPKAAQEAARSSVGGAIEVGHRIGGAAGTEFVNTAKHAFVHGQSMAFLLAAGVALAASFLIWRIMPMHLSYDYEAIQEALDGDEELAEELRELGAFEGAEGADKAVDNGHDGRGRGERRGVGAGSVDR